MLKIFSVSLFKSIKACDAIIDKSSEIKYNLINLSLFVGLESTYVLKST